MPQEQKLDETRGKYLLAVKHGQELNGADWRSCRVVVTTERIVLAGEESRDLLLSAIDRIGDRYDVNSAAAAESNYTTLFVDENVYLVSVPDHETFEATVFRAILEGAVVFVKHPAVEGGVVQDAGWQRGRAKITTDAVPLVTEDGRTVEIERDDVGELATDQKAVHDEERAAIEVEHTDDDGTSVETHLAGRANHLSVLERLLGEGAARNRANLDLSPTERRVVVALYSGVSPFGISEFVGVEAIYDRLIELDVIEVERERTEVALTAQGRTVAGEAMGER